MDLRSGQAFWPIRSGLLANYPRLENSMTCDVVIMGAGITGALIADKLSKEGASVIVLDKRDVARGSTSASTALLQYEIDTHLSELIQKRGKEQAERAYWLCRDAIYKVEDLCKTFKDDCGFERKPSFYYASSKEDVSGIELEYSVRKAAGFTLELWHEADISERFSFSAPAGLYSVDGAQVDAYRLAHRLLARALEQGAQVFDRTEVTQISPLEKSVTLEMAGGIDINAKKLVFASGYESQTYLKEKVVKLKSSYALVTEPLVRFSGWHERCLIWESARPYLYLRTTEEGRAIVGGEDIPFRNPKARDKLLAQKQTILEEKMSKLFPAIPFETAYSWTGTFGETKDGLAYIGESPEYPNAYFALGYGGNGITYSVVATEIIADLFLGKTNHNAEVFRFGR
ncbi:MAG: FAD-dependent oxidoreductase [Trueperaceae bacterium]|nr:FAD-dependent oxidoreductase [Trueperaceae bacterium]